MKPSPGPAAPAGFSRQPVCHHVHVVVHSATDTLLSSLQRGFSSCLQAPVPWVSARCLKAGEYFDPFWALWAGDRVTRFHHRDNHGTTRTFPPTQQDYAAFSAEKRGESREETAGEWRKAERNLFGSPLSFLHSPALFAAKPQMEAATKTRNGYRNSATLVGPEVVPSTWVFPRLIVTHGPMAKSQRTAARLHRSAFLFSERSHYNRKGCGRQT